MQVGKQMPFPGKDKSDRKLIGARKMTGDALCEQTPPFSGVGIRTWSFHLNGDP